MVHVRTRLFATLGVYAKFNTTDRASPALRDDHLLQLLNRQSVLGLQVVRPMPPGPVGSPLASPRIHDRSAILAAISRIPRVADLAMARTAPHTGTVRARHRLQLATSTAVSVCHHDALTFTVGDGSTACSAVVNAVPTAPTAVSGGVVRAVNPDASALSATTRFVIQDACASGCADASPSWSVVA